ncbi:metal ABC transporter permease [Aquimarina sp. AD10]|uniref:metal ABC transporter permease n=1 Tax=Aquimarina sp. AD10 TaxID=1714849 RepID=UPI000E506B61|nr:metal ABC transporter permease [Aquimarina sp. AD10]AXT63315.1 metal ABC transporter permease [Aquimarina sp. AD10]RKN00672.1 metal ABC transporter permease [Aquimarina sp. AD10]
MSNAQIEIQLIASMVAIACAIPGTFLVLRKMALITDAISHSILPGIVIGFFITHDLSSPLLIILAAASGVLTVVLVEFIQKTGLVKEDTAIGLVFPALFSIGIIMISKNANDVHLDVDAVLLGELAFAPFDRLTIGGADIGPKSLWIIGTILLITITLLFAFFKELKVSTFDAGLASALGLSPVVMHYGLMTISSITTVGAFDAVGAILVIALMIAPAATAYLLTNDLKKMLLLSVIFGVSSAIIGYWSAHALDTSISGSMTTILGLIFLFVYLFAPNKGLFSVLYRQKQQRIEVSLLTFLLHLGNHNDDESERHVKHLNEHINWQKVKAKSVLDLALKNNMITIEKDIIFLTEKGKNFTKEAIDYILTNKNSEIEHMKDRFFLFRG